MKKIIPAIFTILVLSFGNPSQAQQTDPVKERISEAVSNYFDLDRETIYAQFDKKVFFTNEQIWFKGYVFNKKTGTPFFETTNVYALLLDQQGKPVSEQLLFCYNGSFSGNFSLNDRIATGSYHIQFYTNWMNNFIEDESFVYDFQIVNEHDNTMTDLDTPDYNNVKIDLYPEGGALVEGVLNNLGVRVTDCSGNPVGASEGQIIDESGQVVKSFPLGKTGNGKIAILPDMKPYKAAFTVNGKTVTMALPKPSLTGIALQVNNYAFPGKTAIQVATNKRTFAALKNPLYLVVQQNDKSAIFDLKLDPEKKSCQLLLSNDMLFKGTNTFRIVDSQLNQLAERFVFEPVGPNPDLMVYRGSVVKDSLTLLGKSAYANANLSISVLPENSVAGDNKNDIFSGFWINPYLKRHAAGLSDYLNKNTKAAQYELDLFFLNQPAGKYEWQNILGPTPAKNYDFDIGLHIKGNINQSIPDPSKYWVRLFSAPAMIEKHSAVSDKKEFLFPNLVFADSTYVSFTLMKLPSVPVDMKFNYQVLNRKRSFNKMFVPDISVCQRPVIKISPMDMPAIASDVIQLKSVEVEKKVKDRLKYAKNFGNANLRGYKVDESNNTQSLISFINQNGFNATYYQGEVIIETRSINSVNAQRLVPLVMINEREIMSFDELEPIQMSEVDEIFLNPHAIVASIKGKMGVIKIYLKKPTYGNPKGPDKSSIIADGFSTMKSFQNAMYLSNADKGFENYGIIDWIATILTDDSGNFRFTVPAYGNKAIRLRIEGFTPEGNPVSETLTIPAKE